MLELPLQEDNKLVTSLGNQRMRFKNGLDQRNGKIAALHYRKGFKEMPY